MSGYKNKLFIVIIGLMLITSFLPDAKSAFTSSGFFFRIIPLLLDISVIIMIFFRFKWVVHAIIIWSAWQIIVSVLLLFGIIFVMVVSESSKFPMGWVVLQVIFGVIKIVGIVYFMFVLKNIKTQNNEVST
jgi:hydrogenase-4 membrane subunit HyfE